MRTTHFITAMCVFSAMGIGCRGLRIKDNRLVCGASRECPAPYACNIEGRCSLEHDAAVDNVDASTRDATSDGDVFDAPSMDSPQDATADVTTDVTGSEEAREDHPEGGMEVQDASPDNSMIPMVLLSVAIGGPSGAGTVLSTTAGVGINCGTTCSALVAQGTPVQLVASPSSSGSFSSWMGCTSVNQAACAVVVTATTTVTATFKLKGGALCGQGTDCASGFCVSSVCCATACAGPCNGSCQTGTCVPKPARAGCGSRPGPGGPGSGSDIALTCDGAGTCKAPSIDCPTDSGNVSCNLNSQACCVVSPNISLAHSHVCMAATSCGVPADGDFYNGNSCSHEMDCPSNQVCCYQTFATGGHWAVCKNACDIASDTLLP